MFKDGQRPTIHRLRQRRGPLGPRASITPPSGTARSGRGGGGGRLTVPAPEEWPPPTKEERRITTRHRETAHLAGKKNV